MRDLEAFFLAARGVAFGYRPPRRDCLIMLADWVVACGSPDPAEPWRGNYSDERGAYEVIREAGGMIPLVDAGMKLASGVRLDDPEAAQTGDVGVVLLTVDSQWAQPPRSFHACGAIRAGRFWAVQAGIGVTMGAGEALAAWRF